MSNDSVIAVNPKQSIVLQLPWTTKLRHNLAYYNPILWWRATVMKKRLVHWNMLEIILLCTLPITLIGTSSRVMMTAVSSRTQHNNDIRTNDPLSTSKDKHNQLYNGYGNFILQILSKYWMIVPVLYSYLFYKVCRSMYSIVTSMYEIYTLRFVTHENAYQCLYDRIQQQRVYRTYSYDMYVPPQSSLSSASALASNDTNSDTSKRIKDEYILFLPGAYVEHIAYSEPASLLSDYGYIVVVMSSEPLGIVDIHLSQFSPSNIQHIQRTVERQYNTLIDGNNNCNNRSRWILMGHSMGSLTCTKLVSKLSNVNEMVMWGSAPFIDFMDDISQYNHNNCNKNIRVLVVQGTNDDIIQSYGTPKSIQEFWNRLPISCTTRYDIIGGTHHGFGNYITQSFDNNSNNINVNCISTTEQHLIAVKATVDFLNHYKSGLD
jgi:predicted esterase